MEPQSNYNPDDVMGLPQQEQSRNTNNKALKLIIAILGLMVVALLLIFLTMRQENAPTPVDLDGGEDIEIVEDIGKEFITPKHASIYLASSVKDDVCLLYTSDAADD